MLACLAAFACPTQAAVIVSIMQSGPDVVATGTGTLDTTGLRKNGPYNDGGGNLDPRYGEITLGDWGSVQIIFFGPITGPKSFGSGQRWHAQSGSGDKFGLGENFTGDPFTSLSLPDGYVSGSALSGTSTYEGMTFSNLGLTPGSYVWTWGDGAHADSFTLNIGTPLSAAYWRGQSGTNWSGDNWATDQGGTPSNGGYVVGTTDVTFSATGATGQLASVVDQNTIINSLTVNSDAGITTGDAATLTINNALNVNDGTLAIKGGIVVNSASATIGNSGSGTGAMTVDGAGTVWNNTNLVLVGGTGSNASLVVSNGGMATTGGAVIGDAAASGHNAVRVTGPSSAWTITNGINIGGAGGNNSLLISNGGTVDSGGVILGDQSTSSENSATVSGSNSQWFASTIYVGNAGASNTLFVGAGGTLDARGHDILLGVVSGSDTNKLDVSDTGSTVKNAANLYVGYAGKSNALFVEHGGELKAAGDLFVGYGGSNNSLDIIVGGKVTNANASVGSQSGSSNNAVSVTGAGSLWTNNGTFYLGESGSGNTLTISLAGKVTVTGTAKDAVIGLNSGSANNTLTVKDSDSEFTNAATIYVGDSGSGNKMEILAGGKVTGHNARIGFNDTSNNNTVNVDGSGSTWTGNGTLRVGGSGSNNALNITNGGTVGMAGNNFIGYAANALDNSVSVSGTSSAYSAGALFVGESGAGTLNVSGSATATVGANGTGTVTLGDKTGSTGTLNIGTSDLLGTAGALNAATVTGGSGTATVNFNHTNLGYTFNPDLTGRLGVNQAGSGKTVLAGATTYSGATHVTGGILAATNLANSKLTLGGGSFSPGDLGNVVTSHVAGLQLSGGTLAFDLATPAVSDKIVSATAAKIDSATSFFFNGVGYTPGAFTLVSNVDPGFGTGFLNFTSNIPGLQGNFYIFNSNLMFNTAFAPGSLDNLAGTPTGADFNVIHGSYTSPAGATNTVTGLVFAPDGTLTLNGPLSITNGLFNAPGGTGVVLGQFPITTPGDFTKIGQGLLNLLSNVVVNGNAYVNSGGLAINGSFTANNLIVALNAYLQGSGFIFGNVFNNGVVAPGNSPGTLHISGNFVQAGTGAMDVELASTALFDRLVVGGNASLAGALNVISYGGFKFEYGQQFAFLQAGSITGTFDSITTSDPAHFRARFLVNGGTGTILLAPTSYTLVARTQNQKNVAKALDSYIPATRGDRLAVSTSLDFLSARQYPQALDAIGPAQYESLATTTIEQYNAQNQWLQQRFSSIRLGDGARGFSQNGLNSPLVSDSGTSHSGKDIKEAKDILTPSPDNRWGVWVQGNGIFGKNYNISDVPNYRFSSGGVYAGADYQFFNGFAAGVFTGYQGTYAKYANGGTMNINAVRFGGYAAYGTGSGFYANLIAGGGASDYTFKRMIQFPGVNRSASSQPSGGEFSSSVDAGYDFRLGKFTLTPVASALYTYVGIAPFTESGARALDLRVNSQSASSLLSSLGARVAYAWKLSGKLSIIPQVGMFWQHEFLQNSRNISSALDGGAGPGFNYGTTVPARDALYAGVGFTIQAGDRWNFNAFYNADLARHDFSSNMVSGGLNFSF